MAVTTDGVVVERFPEILTSIEESQRGSIHPSINNRNDEVLSEMNEIISERLASVNEALESLNDARNILNAEGVQLDNLLIIKKVKRIQPSQSYTNTQLFTGINGLTIPAGRLLDSPTTGVRASTAAAILISSLECYSATLTVPTAINGGLYSITINDGTAYSFTATGVDTPATILTELKDAYDLDPITNVSMTIVGDTIVVSDSTAATFGVTIKVVTTANISITEVSNWGKVSAVDLGAVIVPADTMNKLVVPLAGLTSTTNPDNFIVGRLVETDEELRFRGMNSTASGGTGSEPAITAGLLNNVDGVTAVSIIENDTAVVDGNSQDPHSINIVVVGGDPDDIGQEIWERKSSGIKTVGNTPVSTVRDSNNNLRTVNYTVPVPIYVAVRATYTIYDEEVFPVSGVNSIRQTVLAYVNSLGIGKDLISNRIAGRIYAEVEGIDGLVVETQTILAPYGATEIVDLDYDTVKIAISEAEYAFVSTPVIEIIDAT